MRYPVVIICLTLLSACGTPAEPTAIKAANDMRDNAHTTIDELQAWWNTRPETLPPRPMPPSYCYSVYQDVLCYRQPMPGWEDKLIGYQGTGAEPPPVAMMRPLPSNAEDQSKAPINRVTNARPVFVEPPPELKDLKTVDQQAAAPQPGQAPVVDAAHELLPDPANAPQL